MKITEVMNITERELAEKVVDKMDLGELIQDYIEDLEANYILNPEDFKYDLKSLQEGE